MYNWIILLHTWNEHNTVSQLHFSFLKKKLSPTFLYPVYSSGSQAY